MKNKLVILCSLICGLAIPSKGQDMNVHIRLLPGYQVEVGQNVQLELKVCNSLQSTIYLPPYKILPQVSVDDKALRFISFANMPTGWELCDNYNNQSFTLSNGSDTYGPGECRIVLFNFEGRGVYESNIVANILWGGGTLSGMCGPGPQTVGNDPFNDSDDFDYTVTSPLPLTLVSFTGKTVSCQTLLEWKMEYDETPDQYIIEQSKDGISYVDLDAEIKKEQQGNLVAYKALVSQPFAQGFYRIKVLSTNGESEYSKIITVKNDCIKNTTVSITPNPTRDKVSVNGVTAGDEILLSDGLGRKLQHFFIKENTTLSLDLSSYANGVYQLNISDVNGQKSMHKIIKQD